MAISMTLVVLVVFAFLRNGWATPIPAISVPISLIGHSALCFCSDIHWTIFR
jgi:multidrug efflux pump